VRHALQRHDGTLTIESVEGRGSAFTCHFPTQRVVPRPPEFFQAKSSA
jgi:two-component system phosphate regulon sensor histidine kinase PhoR